jgi:hypothetical protein
MYYFNWTELWAQSNGEPESILILTYGLTMGYNNIIAKSGNHLIKKLYINKINFRLFRTKQLKSLKNHLIINNYKCKDIQSYFKNKSFLTSTVNPVLKVEYLYILSKRSIANHNHYIPKNYVSSAHWKNTFVKERPDILEFTLEK